MRFDGKLEKWNDDRAFGFITPSHGGDPIFVHVSAFQLDSRLPKIGEALTFEVEIAADGKKSAVNVQRPQSAEQRQRPTERGSRTGSLLLSVALVVALLGVGVYSYSRYAARTQRSLEASPAPASVQSGAQFKCDGRKYCSQMTSCEEATFFLKNCPGTQMDGDGNGIPCEKQWCGGKPGR